MAVPAEPRSGVDEIHLAVPASPEFLRLARVTATGLASRVGFTFDEVEDLRLAIDELCFALIGTKGQAGVVRLEYRLRPDGLEIVGTLDSTEAALVEPKLTEWSDQILTALVDEHEVTGGPEAEGGKAHPRFRLVKRRAVV